MITSTLGNRTDLDLGKTNEWIIFMNTTTPSELHVTIRILHFYTDSYSAVSSDVILASRRFDQANIRYRITGREKNSDLWKF